MRFTHPDHGTAVVRLAYCTNLHAGESLAEIREGLQRFTLAVKRELAIPGAFGIGIYLPAKVALHLAAEGGREDLHAFAGWLREQGLDPFTFNAFPYGDFQRDGLKEDVYRPMWTMPERRRYTRAVARVAAFLIGDGHGTSRHISISTHPGAHVSQVQSTPERHDHARGLAQAVVDLVVDHVRGAPPVVLSVEAEPWAIAGNSRALVEHLALVATRAEALLMEQHEFTGRAATNLVERHLGTCLDACHSAVEFESPGDAVSLARVVGCMGKLQYSNALRVENPANNRSAVDALIALDEPRFLHQVTGLHPTGLQTAGDLSDLKDTLASDESQALWNACEEWRCHFHVPVNLPEFAGLGTTQVHADAILSELLADPGSWRTPELHVEIETYTWNILPGAKPDGLVQGLVAEYAHVLDLLRAAGWTSA
ncbi:MAG: metabolite traffic protein EboE [bacterium]|nr:metabolite traffic protein EboE [bacterium]